MWSIIIGFVLSIAIALLTPKPKIEDATASGIEDFSFPTVSESRNITIVCGTRRISGPNVGVVENLVTQPIEESVKTGMFSSDDVTVGFKYFIDMALFFCWGEASLLQIDMGDFTAWKGRQDTEGAVQVNEPFLYGYDPTEGGVQGTFYFYSGTSAQTSNAYLNSRVRQQPGFKDICYGVWQGGYIGNSQNVRPFSVVLERLPNPLGRPDTEFDINGDGNPAFFLYEILNSEEFGKGYGTDILDSTSFLSAGQTLATEGLGVSMVFDNKTDINNIVQQLEQHMNGNLYFDPELGKIKLNLVRQDYVIGDLPVLDETNIKAVKNYTKGGATNLVTEVKVRYIDRSANFKDRVAPALDTGTRQILGKPNARTLDYLGLSNGTIAGQVALRDLLPLGAYMATVNIWVNRDGASFYEGQPVNFKWSPLGITQLILRIKAVDIGTLVDGTVKLSCVEDVFAVGAAIFDPNPDSGWLPINSTPAEIVNNVGLDAPFWYLQGVPSSRLMWLAKSENSDSQGFNIWARNVTALEVDLTQVQQNAAYSNAAQLNTDFGKEGLDTLVIKGASFSFGFETKTIDQILQEGQNMLLAYVSNTQHEFIAFEDYSYDLLTDTYTLTGVQRGMLDTVAHDFAEDAFIWFVKNVGTGSITYGATDDVRYKLQSVTSLGEFDISTISETIKLLQNRPASPYPPGRFYVNGVQWPSGILGVVDLNLTWQHRAKSIDLLQTQIDNTGTLETNVTYTIEFRNEVGTLIRTLTGQTGTSYSYLIATYTADNGGTAPYQITATIFAVDSGVTLNSLFNQVRVAQLQPIFLNAIDSNDATLNGLTLRNIIPASAIQTDSETLTLKLTADAGAAITIDKMFIGHQATSGDAYDFDPDRIQVTFDGGNPGKTIAAGTTINTDQLEYDLDRTKNLVFSIYFTAANASFGSGGITGAASYTISGDDAATIDATGYSLYTANTVFVLAEIDN